MVRNKWYKKKLTLIKIVAKFKYNVIQVINIWNVEKRKFYTLSSWIIYENKFYTWITAIICKLKHFNKQTFNNIFTS